MFPDVIGAHFIRNTFFRNEVPFESSLEGKIMFMTRYDLQIAPSLCLMQEGNRPFAGIGKNKLKCTGLILIFCR